MNVVEHRRTNWFKSLGPVLWRVARPSRVPDAELDWTGVYRSSTGTGVAPRVDVYLPRGEGPFPSVVLIHGGGFLMGSRRMAAMKCLAAGLRDHGYAVASIDYRLIFRGGRLDEALEDVREAYTWWRTQSMFPLDLDRVAVLGCSAGAALTILGSGDFDNLWKMVGLYGVYDFCDLPGSPNPLPARLLLRSTDRARWQVRSPYVHLGASVPLLLAHGTRDKLVHKRHTDRMASARRRAGLPVQTRYYEGEPHGFLQDGLSRPASGVALNDILYFLDA